MYVLDLVDRIAEHRVSRMDGVNFKALLWIYFLCWVFSSFIFMVEKCVHLDIWDLKKRKKKSIFKGSPKKYFEIYKENLIPNTKIYTFFHHKNEGGKCMTPKTKPQ